MLGGGLGRLALAMVATFTLVVSAHVVAPTARAECDGGVPYAAAVKLARGTIVGVITEVGRDENSLLFAAEVRIERAVGTAAGSAWRGKAYAGMACNGDEPNVGARVVVLLDVTIPDVPPSDQFYTIGFAVTPAQVARVADDLPDTATGGLVDAATRPASPLGPAFLAACVAVSALFLWRPRRRQSRSS